MKQEVIPCKHCEGTGQMLWRPPERAGGVGEECSCEWCDGAGYVLQRASGEPCAICGGTGTAVVPIAYEDAQGIVHHEVKHQTCHGCNGTGKAK